MNPKLKIKKGDQVVVITGKDKGKTGEILTVLPKENRVIVKGINLVKKNQKSSATNPGGITSMEMSIHASNVALIDPKSNKPTRAGYKIDDKGEKTRISKKSGEAIA